MIQSMTGYGEARSVNGDLTLTVTLKSVNHRFFDLTLKAPPELQWIEPAVRQSLKKKLLRGAVTASLTVERGGPLKYALNAPLIATYLEAAREIQNQYQLSSELDLATLLKLPNALLLNAETANTETQSRLEILVNDALEQAAEKLTAMRMYEGSQLYEELAGRVQTVMQHIERIEDLLRTAKQDLFAKLNANLQQLLHNHTLDETRLAEQVAYLAEKSDVSEELARLKCHTAQFQALLQSSGEIGKKMDFLLQEMNREVNTILSKIAGAVGQARDATDRAIEAKAEIEKLREQVQNVL